MSVLHLGCAIVYCYQVTYEFFWFNAVLSCHFLQLYFHTQFNVNAHFVPPLQRSKYVHEFYR